RRPRPPTGKGLISPSTHLCARRPAVLRVASYLALFRLSGQKTAGGKASFHGHAEVTTVSHQRQSAGEKKRLPGWRLSPRPRTGALYLLAAIAVDQLMTVTPRRFCAQAASLSPSTAGRSLP